MTREPHIPLFLWVTTAIVVHLAGGGGAHEAAVVLEERMDLKQFAGQVQRHARFAVDPVEVSFVEEDDENDDDAASESEQDAELDESDQDTDPAVTPEDDERPPEPKPEPKRIELPEPKKPEQEKEEPEEKKQEQEKEEPEEKKQEQEKEEPEEKDDEKEKKLPVPMPQRVAVVQLVEDKNQKDNPDAKFAGEHANHVDEETQARITSTDRNQDAPTPGQAHHSDLDTPGNSDEQRIGQSRDGSGDSALGEEGAYDRSTAPAQRAYEAAASGYSRGSQAVETQTSQTAQEYKAASEAQAARPDIVSSEGGSFDMSGPQQARAAQQGQKKRLPRTGRAGSTQMLGYGSEGVTRNGVNLNLNPRMAQAVIDADEMAEVRRRAGERRLSQHRGGWDNLGMQRWRSAIENYTAAVKPGNQTALNTARVPFAKYLNQIHQRIHQVFAVDYLQSLESLPADHPLSDPEMSTHLEIVLSPQDGSVVNLGVTKTSGVTMFDVGALEAVRKAAPFGVPPGSIVSSDGNVYLHWEFHRKRIWACSTYFARPYILNKEQKQAPPRVEPPARPDYDEQEADERSGSINEDDVSKDDEPDGSSSEAG